MENENVKLEEDVEKIDALVSDKVDAALNMPRNRAERRAQQKRNRKGYRNDIKHLDNISEAAKRMVFAELIQGLRKLNAEKEKEKNGTIEEV